MDFDQLKAAQLKERAQEITGQQPEAEAWIKANRTRGPLPSELIAAELAEEILLAETEQANGTEITPRFSVVDDVIANTPTISSVSVGNVGPTFTIQPPQQEEVTTTQATVNEGSEVVQNVQEATVNEGSEVVQNVQEAPKTLSRDEVAAQETNPTMVTDSEDKTASGVLANISKVSSADHTSDTPIKTLHVPEFLEGCSSKTSIHNDGHSNTLPNRRSMDISKRKSLLERMYPGSNISLSSSNSKDNVNAPFTLPLSDTVVHQDELPDPYEAVSAIDVTFRTPSNSISWSESQSKSLGGHISSQAETNNVSSSGSAKYIKSTQDIISEDLFRTSLQNRSSLSSHSRSSHSSNSSMPANLPKQSSLIDSQKSSLGSFGDVSDIKTKDSDQYASLQKERCNSSRFNQSINQESGVPYKLSSPNVSQTEPWVSAEHVPLNQSTDFVRRRQERTKQQPEAEAWIEANGSKGPLPSDMFAAENSTEQPVNKKTDFNRSQERTEQSAGEVNGTNGPFPSQSANPVSLGTSIITNETSGPMFGKLFESNSPSVSIPTSEFSNDISSPKESFDSSDKLYEVKDIESNSSGCNSSTGYMVAGNSSTKQYVKHEDSDSAYIICGQSVETSIIHSQHLSGIIPANNTVSSPISSDNVSHDNLFSQDNLSLRDNVSHDNFSHQTGSNQEEHWGIAKDPPVLKSHISREQEEYLAYRARHSDHSYSLNVHELLSKLPQSQEDTLHNVHRDGKSFMSSTMIPEHPKVPVNLSMPENFCGSSCRQNARPFLSSTTVQNRHQLLDESNVHEADNSMLDDTQNIVNQSVLTFDSDRARHVSFSRMNQTQNISDLSIKTADSDRDVTADQSNDSDNSTNVKISYCKCGNLPHVQQQNRSVKVSKQCCGTGIIKIVTQPVFINSPQSDNVNSDTETTTEGRVDSENKKLRSMTKILLSKNEEVVKLRAKIASLQNEITKLRRAGLQERQPVSINSPQPDNVNSDTETTVEGRVNSENKKISSLTKIVLSKNEEVEELRAKNTSLQNEITKLRRAGLQENNYRYSQQQQHLADSIFEKCGSLNSKYNASQNVLTRLQQTDTAGDEFFRDQERLKKILDDFAGVNGTLLQNLDAQNSDIRDLTSRLQATDHEKTGLISEIQILKNKLSKHGISREQCKSALEQQKNKLESHCSTITSNLTSLQENCTLLSGKVADLTELNESLTKRNDELFQEKNLLQSCFNQSKNKLASLEQNCATLEARLHKPTSSNLYCLSEEPAREDFYQKQIQHHMNKCEELQRQLKEKSDVTMKLESKLTRETAKNDVLEKQLSLSDKHANDVIQNLEQHCFSPDCFAANSTLLNSPFNNSLINVSRPIFSNTLHYALNRAANMKDGHNKTLDDLNRKMCSVKDQVRGMKKLIFYSKTVLQDILSKPKEPSNIMETVDMLHKHIMKLELNRFRSNTSVGIKNKTF